MKQPKTKNNQKDQGSHRTIRRLLAELGHCPELAPHDLELHRGPWETDSEVAFIPYIMLAAHYIGRTQQFIWPFYKSIQWK